MMDKQWRFIPDRAPQAAIDGLLRAVAIKSKAALVKPHTRLLTNASRFF